MLPLEQIITTEQLALRPRRSADLAAENEVLLALAAAMADKPEAVLQQLVDAARMLCDAGSAGISLLETGATPEETHFRWKATAGKLGPYKGHTMPRHFSPCGSVLDRDAMLLMDDPVRHFDHIEGLPAPVREALLVPFYRGSIPIGTLWIVAHEEDRHFDLEDARIVTNLSRFAAAAVQVLATADEHVRLQREAREAAERRLAEVAAQHRRLAASERDKIDFLATLTHELRNGLAPIANAAQIVKFSADESIRAKAQDILQRQLAQMSRLVDDLLDVARLSGHKLRLDMGMVNLTAALAAAVEANRARIEQGGQALALALPQEAVQTKGDEIRLAQVFTNVLTNAAKYGTRGGTVRVSLRCEAGHALVSVKDEGVGIDAQMLPRIFDLFVQADDSLRASEGGLGIGLALVKSLVEMHGGEVAASSEGLGRGSEFTIRLPLAL